MVFNASSPFLDTESVIRGVEEALKSSPLLLAKTVKADRLPVALVVDTVVQDKAKSLLAEEEATNTRRREYVKATFESLFHGYVNACSPVFPRKSLSEDACIDEFGVNLARLDALDLLWMIGLKTDFAESQLWIESNLQFIKAADVSVPDTSSRVVGGLLAAFELTNRPFFLKRAALIADRLLPAFEKLKTGLPLPIIDLLTGKAKYHHNSEGVLTIGEIAGSALEFVYLAHHLNELRFAHKPLNAIQYLRLHATDDQPGQYATHIDAETGAYKTRLLSLNPPSDLFYKTLYKLVKLCKRRVKWLNEMWKEAEESIAKQLFAHSGSLFYHIEVELGENDGHFGARQTEKREGGEAKVSHASCGLSALLSMYAQDIEDSQNSKDLFEFGEGFAATCVEMNRKSPNGIAPSFSTISTGQLQPIADSPSESSDHMNADTFEALFFLSRLTGNPKYREFTWELFEAICKHFQLRTSSIKSTIQSNNAFTTQYPKVNAKAMRFLTKAFRFAYLTFSDTDVLPINTYIFNDDGHPLASLKPDVALYS